MNYLKIFLPWRWKFCHSNVDKVGAFVVEDNNLFERHNGNSLVVLLHDGLPTPGLKQILKVLVVHRHLGHLVPNCLVAPVVLQHLFPEQFDGLLGLSVVGYGVEGLKSILGRHWHAGGRRSCWRWT